MPLSDTSPHIRKMLLEMERRMTGEERLQRMLEACELVREFSKAGIRNRHPDWTEAQVERELLGFAFLPGKLPAGF